MKKSSWLLRHGLFWLIYFSVNLFNELYLSASFTAHPSSELFFDSVLSQLLILLVKIPAVYYVLYSFINRWLKAASKARLLLECAFVLLGFLLAYRLMIQWVVWPYVYHELHSPQGLQLIARYFYSFLDLLQVIGIAATIKLFRLRVQAMKNENALVQEKLQSEILHLRSQINPHFLFNTLNSIYSLARSQSPDAPDAVMRLSKMLRFMLYETQKKTIAIEDELKMIQDYISLQELRFGKRAAVELSTDIDDKSGQVAPLLMLPLVENAFKHGMGSTHVSNIAISISLKNKQLKVMVQNPAVAPSIKQEPEQGIGLSNIRRQLQLLYRQYNFTFGAHEQNFVVKLDINLTSYAGFELFNSGR
jgi:two-component system, LytTR family, sensor kinase